MQTCIRKPLHRAVPYLSLLLIIGLWLSVQFKPETVARAQGPLAGRVIDSQGEPVQDVHVRAFLGGESEPIAEDETLFDGTYVLLMTEDEAELEELRIVYERAHFKSADWSPSITNLDDMTQHGGLILPDVTLERRFSLGFWIATLTFLGMLLVIATEKLHNTLAALLSIAVVFSISLVGGTLNPELFILDFEQALEHVDFEVIFLLLGMMIVIGVIEETGIFQWLAYQAYRLSRGKVWVMTIILMLMAAAASALLDNVTTMLLMTPITLQIALAMGLNPLSLLMPALMAANTGGLMTLVGTPVNIIVGSYAGLGFNDFLLNLTPGVIMCEASLIAYVLWRYRKEHRRAGHTLSADQRKRLEENARIEDSIKLRKAGIVFIILMGLFIFGEAIHLPPAVAAIIGAVAMLLWVHPDVEAMLKVVDWTTLVFFIALFMMVGAIQEVGLISWIAGGVGTLVGDNPIATLLGLVWVSALLSGVIDNIPFAAAMLPVVRYLSVTVPGMEGGVLFYSLALGADLGGNSSLIASSANLVVAGISERAGYRITFRKFVAIGLPATLITTAVGTVWLLIHFF
jgi:Na+/H+ antiporter NhaD/arsenite permease-like protein